LKACFHKGSDKKERCERSEQRLSVVKHPQNGTREAESRATLPPLLEKAFQI